MKKQVTKPNELLNEDAHIELEDDQVWSLLNEASCEKARPSFVRNVMREVRISEADKAEQVSWWAKLVRPRFYVPACVGVAAAAAVCFSVLPINPSSPDPTGGASAGVDKESQTDFITQELKALEAEDPMIMTADEIGILVTSNDVF